MEKIANLLDLVTARLQAPIVAEVPIDHLVVQVQKLMDEIKLPSPLLLTKKPAGDSRAVLLDHLLVTHHAGHHQ